MPYVPYADAAYYEDIYLGTDIPSDSLSKCLRQASRHIDSLTYNRIVGRGFSGLTPYQQEIIQEVVCQQAEFEYSNQEMLESVLSSYSLGNVSMTFGASWNVFADKGIAMKRDVYAQLSQTGLTSRLLR